MFNKYGLIWPDGTEFIDILLYMIRQNDEFIRSKNTTRAELYLKIHSTLWPEDDQHRWFTLGMTRIVENQITVLVGSASSAKTHTMSCHALITFFANPQNSFGMISSTEKRSLEIKVWGRVKGLYNRAKRRFPHLPGYVLDSMMAITANDIDDENDIARQLNSGLICIPCVSGGKFVGMSKYQGAKPPHTPGKSDGLLAHYGDEAAVMQHSFLDAYANWTVNGAAFKGVMAGNPTDISDPLCTASEPKDGWDAFIDTGKTQEWTSKWNKAHVIAFDGRDTPNNDGGKQFPYLITKKFVDALAETHGLDSWQYYQQGIGKPSRGMVSNRVITVDLCERNRAFESVIWSGSPITNLYSCDPSFGGGDRCMFMKLRMGTDIEGKQILDCGKQEEIQIKINSRMEASEQIAAFIKDKSDKEGVPAENIFYDSLGSTQLGFAFAKVFGANCPVPVESGGKPTERPVRFDLYIIDHSPNGTTSKRLKTCREQYSKMVDELWWSTREAVESQQIRGLSRDIVQEGQYRLYEIVAGDKICLESKADLKERLSKSCDQYDCFAIGVEGARRKGFKIQRIGADVKTESSKNNWLEDLKKKRDKMFKSKGLKTA